MTLAENTNWINRQRYDARTQGGARADGHSFNALLSTEDEVIVFRRDPSSGTYQMSTACCEDVLPPVNQ